MQLLILKTLAVNIIIIPFLYKTRFRFLKILLKRGF